MNQKIDPTMDAASIELRVLHGPQAGARLPLVKGQAYTIGSGDTCAIALGGAQVAPEHALVSADDDGITVVALQGRVKTSGGAVDADSPALPLGTVLQFGLVKLTVARLEDEWPADEALEDVEPVSEAPEERVESPPAPATAPPSKNPVMRTMPVARPWFQGLRGWAISCFVGIFIAGIGAVLALSGASEAKPAAASLASPAAAAAASAASALARSRAMDELMKGFPDRGLVAKPHPDGSWTITGRLATDAERQVLRDAASVTGLTVKVQVTVESERVAAVKLFADANQAPGRLELRVEQGREGAVRIAGAAATLEDAASLQEKARKELAEQEPLEFDIVQPEQIERLFIKRLTEAGLKDKFQIVQGAPKLVVRATLAPPDIRAFELAFAEFTKQHGSVLPIVAQVQPERDVIAASVGTVVGGAFPYIVTTSGQRIAPGGLLGGHTVVAVRDGEIILSEGLRVRYGP